MSFVQDNLNCALCNLQIIGKKYMKCSVCHSSYHFSPCCSIQISSYGGMSAEKKAAWKCLKCKERRGSNTSYEIIIAKDSGIQKQKRNEEEDDEVFSDTSKRFKNKSSEPPQPQQNSTTQQQSSISDGNEAIKLLAQSMTQVTSQLSSISAQLQNQQSTLMQLNENVLNLSHQVNELQKQNKEKDEKISVMEVKINKLEQKIIEKNLEINNVSNDTLSATDVIKKIATSVNVELSETDIDNAYKIKRNNKVVVELCSLRKKKEIMSSLKRHRIDAKVINNENNENNNKAADSNNKQYIYINDQLTPSNRRLLWLAKTKAKEAKWKFVWVSNGAIRARKIEEGEVVNIITENDLELIN